MTSHKYYRRPSLKQSKTSLPLRVRQNYNLTEVSTITELIQLGPYLQRPPWNPLLIPKGAPDSNRTLKISEIGRTAKPLREAQSPMLRDFQMPWVCGRLPMPVDLQPVVGLGLRHHGPMGQGQVQVRGSATPSS